MNESKGFSLTRTSLYTACAFAMGIGGTRAYAQEESVGPIEEVTVTGTRVRMTDGMAEPTPVTSVTRQELDMFEPGGTVAEQLDALPQFFATGTAQRGGPTLFGDGGGSYLDMRGLGRNRTLVLLDGSRVVPADKRGTVNVDNIPMALVRSVDVITGGASAAYGADALAGVTNFVLNRQFQGLEMSLGTGMNVHNSDGKNYNLGIAGGFEIGDRWNFIGSIDARHIDEIYRDPRDLDSDWFQRWGHMTNPDPNGPARITVPWATPTGLSPSGVISVAPDTGPSALSGLQFTDDGTALRPFELGNITNAGYTSGGPESTRYSDATLSPITGNGVENRSGFAALRYEATDNLSIYGQALIGRTESLNTSRQSTFAMTTPWYETIYRENPYLPASVAAIMDAEGRTEFRLNKVGSYPGDLEAGAGEFDHQVFKTESYTAGFDFTLANDWALSGSYQSGESRKGGGQYHSLRVDLEALARDAAIDPATGDIVCNVQLFNPTPAELANAPEIQGLTAHRGETDLGTPLLSPIGLDNAVSECVPYNAMGAGNMNQAAWNYMHKTPKTNDSWVKQDFAELLLQGEAFDGLGYGPLLFATGLTWREQSFHDEYLNVEVDVLGPPINSPSLGIRGIATAYAGGTPNLHHFSTISLLDGKYDVWEWFGELNVPLWESGDGNRGLGGSLAVRRSDYSSSGEQDSWKYGLEWQAFRDLRFRGTRSRDVREASFQERFDVQTGGTVIDDPVTGMMDVNVTFRRGGNPNLRPEAADTTVFGFVYEPSYAQGLSVSLDWYEIDISGAVDSITEQQIVDQCFETGSPELCSLITRDINNVPVGVAAPFLNLSTSFAEGIDFELAYNREINLFASRSENLSFRVLGGKLRERYDQPPGGAPINQIGSATRPELTANATLRYSVGPWSATWQQRYISDTLVNLTWVEGVDVDNNTIPTYSFTNLLFRYDQDSTSAGNSWSVGLAINNAFDKNPPIIPGAFNRVGSQTNSGLGYDEFGRRFQVTLGMSF
jgi:outer membrane receptor protein involved in Fe transport